MSYFIYKIKINKILIKALFNNNIKINIINEKTARMI